MKVSMKEKLRLGMVMGAGPLLGRSLLFLPPSRLREGHPEVIAEYADDLAEIGLQDAARLGMTFNENEKLVVAGLASAACRAAVSHPHAMRAFCRLYTAGFQQDPAFTNPQTREFPDALAGMGIEQRILHLRHAVSTSTGEAKRWSQLMLLLAILEGRVRPIGLSAEFLALILSNRLPDPKNGETLAPWHREISNTFFTVGPTYYEDSTGNPDSRQEPRVKDFAESRNRLRLLDGTPCLGKNEKDALLALRKMLRQEIVHPSKRSGTGGVNYEEVRHAIAHVNISLEADRTVFHRGTVMWTFLGDEDKATLSSMTHSQLDETVEEAWRLLGVSWAWQLVLNMLDVWLSGRVLPHVKYPQPNRHSIASDRAYTGRASTVLAALAASLGGQGRSD